MGVTIKQIAKMAGVSRGTVDRVLHNRYGVDPDVKARVEEIIKRVNYKPNAVAQALKLSERSLRFGYIIPDCENQFWDEVITGFQDAEAEYESHGVQLIRMDMKELSVAELLRCASELMEQKISGLFLPGMDSPEVQKFVNAIPDTIPVITFNNDVPDCRRLCFVGQNHYEAGKTAGRLMSLIVEKGKVAVFSGQFRSPGHVSGRFEGFCETVHSLRPDIGQIIRVDHQETEEATYALAAEILKDQDVTGIYVTGEGAVGAAKALKESGRANEIKMLCFDIYPDIINAIREDIIDITIGQESYMQGYLPVKLMYDFLTFGILPARSKLYTDIDIRVKENVDYKSLPGMLNQARARG